MQRTLFTTLMATSFMAVSLKYIMPREIEKVRSAHDTASVCVCVWEGGRQEIPLVYVVGKCNCICFISTAPNQMKGKERGGGRLVVASLSSSPLINYGCRRRYNSGSPSPRRRGRSYSRSPSPRRRRRHSHSRSPSPRRKKSYSRSPSPRQRRSRHSQSPPSKRGSSPQQNDRSGQ